MEELCLYTADGKKAIHILGINYMDGTCHMLGKQKTRFSHINKRASWEEVGNFKFIHGLKKENELGQMTLEDIMAE